MKRFLATAFVFLLVINFFLAQAQISRAPLKYIEFVLTPDHADWVYKTREKAKVEIQVLKNGVALNDVTVHYEIGPEMMEPDKEGDVTTKKGSAEVNMGTSKEPGFRQCKVEATIEGHKYRDLIKVGYSPDEIKPTEKLPDDFQAFWDKAKADNANLPLDATYTFLPDYSTSTVDVYLVSFQNFRKGHRLYGYLSKPRKPGKYPGVVIYPGAGVKPQLPPTSFADQGFISLSIEIHGISPMLNKDLYSDLSHAFGDYMFSGLESPDRYYYKKVYIGCTRAIDFLVSQPEYDGEHLAVTGGSQGGMLTMVTASLDSRVKCLAAFYPAFCDVTGDLHGRAGGWPHLFSSKYKGEMNNSNAINTVSYYDVVNFARFIKVPGFYSFGYNDTTCPPTGAYSAINSVSAPKTVVITPISGHWRFPESNEKSVEFIKKQFGMR